jgi:hypothetical protein
MKKYLPYLKPEWHGEWGLVWLGKQWVNILHPTEFYDSKFPPLSWFIYFSRDIYGSQTLYSFGFLGLRKSFSIFER